MVPVESMKDPTSEQRSWHSLAQLSLVTNPSWPHSKGGRAVQGSGRCVPKQTPVLCKYLQQQESHSDHRGGEACQCETQGTGTMGTWEGSAPSKGAGGQPWWVVLCRCADLNFPALSSIQMKPEIQINMWNLRLWNIGNKFIFLFNNLRTKQNTSAGGSCLQDAQFCDPGLSPSSKAPGSSHDPFTSSPSPESGVAPLNGWQSTLAHWGRGSSVGPGRLAEFRGFVLNMWYHGLASGRSPKTPPESCQIFSTRFHNLSGEQALQEGSFEWDQFLLAASPWKEAELPHGCKGITSSQIVCELGDLNFSFCQQLLLSDFILFIYYIFMYIYKYT